MQRTYEVMFIVRPDMVDEEADKLVSTLESGVTASGDRPSFRCCIGGRA